MSRRLHNASFESDGEDKFSILTSAISEGNFKGVLRFIQSDKLDLNTLLPPSYWFDPLLFQIIESDFNISRKKELIRQMVGHGADIHLEYTCGLFDTRNILLKACSKSMTMLEFLLTEYNFSNEEMLQAIESINSARSLQIFLAHGLILSSEAIEKLFINAVCDCNVRFAEFLLKEYQVSTNCHSERGWLPLHHACYESTEHPVADSQRLRLVKLLLKYGADINAKTKEHITPLMLVSSPAIFDFLLQKGADLYAVTRTLHKNVLIKQAENRNALPIIRTLVEDHGFDLNSKDGNGATALLYAVKAGNPEVVKYLIENGADVQVIDKDGRNALFWGRSPEIVRYLIRCGVPVSHRDNKGRNVLFHTNNTCLRILLKAGADATVVADDGSTVLMRSDFELTVKDLKLLIRHGADPCKSPGGVAGLVIWWMEHGHPWICEAILLYLIKQYSLDPNLRDSHGRSPIFYCGEHTRNALIKLGTSLHITDHHGNTPLLYWYQIGDPASKRFLKDLNHRNADGKNVLHYAVANKGFSVIKTLLIHGADWNIKDNSGRTALDYARELKRFDICELMENYNHSI